MPSLQARLQVWGHNYTYQIECESIYNNIGRTWIMFEKKVCCMLEFKMSYGRRFINLRVKTYENLTGWIILTLQWNWNALWYSCRFWSYYLLKYQSSFFTIYIENDTYLGVVPIYVHKYRWEVHCFNTFTTYQICGCNEHPHGVETCRSILSVFPVPCLVFNPDVIKMIVHEAAWSRVLFRENYLFFIRIKPHFESFDHSIIMFLIHFPFAIDLLLKIRSFLFKEL